MTPRESRESQDTGAAILCRMVRSVADELRERDRQAVLRLPAAARVALALRLGEFDLEIFCANHGLDRDSGLRRLRQGRRQGRTFSACMSSEAA